MTMALMMAQGPGSKKTPRGQAWRPIRPPMRRSSPSGDTRDPRGTSRPRRAV
eukprot:NODE_9430_length_228_cov_0.854749_g8815_i0.p3 GENE.NODE_9430_length_228_cov_0.854749_g8815_i0~~NODE_9430_length_228_cov_0.854749_g8815_i0.p3  ORF type:complete len:52 (-),score=7.88 NODE_9430_length_228_cov_0.854749_g8815_i0:44-199(-)